MNPSGINAFVRSEPSGSNHFPKANYLAIKPLIHEPFGEHFTYKLQHTHIWTTEPEQQVSRSSTNMASFSEVFM
jgi:hypothetical protein